MTLNLVSSIEWDYKSIDTEIFLLCAHTPILCLTGERGGGTNSSGLFSLIAKVSPLGQYSEHDKII